ncbi:hypothetical protein ABZ926_06990 [Streptomyces litmocidini]|uniref:ABM domain-containing protein n=1 Tax=Streptomyces litmocidini TaxID=67318 RepID=A0ABW7UBK6_9ACTN|nr:hypothetical protein [Streptomyces sp. PanSC19]ROQ26772.1 hypothetical protein EDD98_6421 [Streptomyces sp. PanSC19]
MAILVKSELPGVTTDQYDALNGKLQALPGNTFQGCLSHACVSTGSGLVIHDLWESEQDMQKFMGLVMPLAEEMGLPQGPQPEIHQVHNYWTP